MPVWPPWDEQILNLSRVPVLAWHELPHLIRAIDVSSFRDARPSIRVATGTLGMGLGTR